MAKKEIVVKSVGIAETSNSSKVVSQVSSFVEEIFYQEGDTINEGDLIIQLQDSFGGEDTESYKLKTPQNGQVHYIEKLEVGELIKGDTTVLSAIDIENTSSKLSVNFFIANRDIAKLVKG